MCTLECFGPCCGMFSIIGFIYLIIMGIIVDKQPQFVHGIEDAKKSAAACYGGAGIYAGTLVLSIGAYIYDQKKKARRAATNALLKEEQQSLTAGGGGLSVGSYGTGGGGGGGAGAGGGGLQLASQSRG